MLGQKPRTTPMRNSELGGRRHEGCRHDRLMIELAGPVRPGTVGQSLQPRFGIPAPPGDHRRTRNRCPRGDLGVGAPAARNTILARRAGPAAAVEDRANDTRVARSPSLEVRAATRIHDHPKPAPIKRFETRPTSEASPPRPRTRKAQPSGRWHQLVKRPKMHFGVSVEEALTGVWFDALQPPEALRNCQFRLR